jgi:chromosome segregation ATPase
MEREDPPDSPLADPGVQPLEEDKAQGDAAVQSEKDAKAQQEAEWQAAAAARAEEIYKRTLDKYGGKLRENSDKLAALQSQRSDENPAVVPPAKMTNSQLKDDLAQKEAQLRDLEDAIARLSPEVNELEAKYQRRESDLEARRARSGRSSSLQRRK